MQIINRVLNSKICLESCFDKPSMFEMQEKEKNGILINILISQTLEQ